MVCTTAKTTLCAQQLSGQLVTLAASKVSMVRYTQFWELQNAQVGMWSQSAEATDRSCSSSNSSSTMPPQESIPYCRHIAQRCVQHSVL